ncbi:MAG TPA: aminoacetone oxidase family FAD-binding enzyme [Abditibacteriaceae bacterium]
MNSQWDVLIVGAGAAGLMAAIAAAAPQKDGRRAKVLLLDGQTKIGAKILVAGGGRCNVTNERVDATRFHTDSSAPSLNKSFVARVLRSFSVEQTHRFFAAAGVELKLEPTGKYFPVSDSARTVLNALLEQVRQSGAELRTGVRVHALNESEGVWTLRTADGEISARAVIVCTGGLALPKSGSDGAGLEWARKFGHTIVETTPALTPLLANPARHAGLSGITHDARLILRDGQKVLADYTGSFLWTHVGYSGPTALNISRHFAREGGKVFARLWPEIEDADVARVWHDWIKAHAKQSVFNALTERLPVRVAQMLMQEAKIADGAVGKLSPNHSHALRDAVLNLELPVASVAPYYKAETTAGGVSLDELESASMMSKLRAGLFFAGEVCDVDGWLGGYNFQWAWSSGTVAGRGAAKYALK